MYKSIMSFNVDGYDKQRKSCRILCKYHKLNLILVVNYEPMLMKCINYYAKPDVVTPTCMFSIKLIRANELQRYKQRQLFFKHNTLLKLKSRLEGGD